MKKYIIKEEQYLQLINKKKNDRIVEEILAKIEKADTKLNESKLSNSFKETILKEYADKGYMNDYVKTKLKESGKLQVGIL